MVSFSPQIFSPCTFLNSVFPFSGRTGRCEQSGTAYTFFTPSNARQARDLLEVLKEAGQNCCAELIELARGAVNGRSRWPVRPNPVPQNNQNKNKMNMNAGGKPNKIQTWNPQNDGGMQMGGHQDESWMPRPGQAYQKQIKPYNWNAMGGGPDMSGMGGE